MNEILQFQAPPQPSGLKRAGLDPSSSEERIRAEADGVPHEASLYGALRSDASWFPQSSSSYRLIGLTRQGINDKKTEDTMSTPTREEIDAKLAASEARNETRFVEIAGKLDRIADSIGSYKELTDRDVQALRLDLNHKFDALHQGFEPFRDLVAQTRADNKYTRLTIVIAVVSSAFAAVGLVFVTQQTLLTAFQAGLATIGTAPAP